MEKKKTLNTRALIRFWKMIKPEHKYFSMQFIREPISRSHALDHGNRDR